MNRMPTLDEIENTPTRDEAAWLESVFNPTPILTTSAYERRDLRGDYLVEPYALDKEARILDLWLAKHAQPSPYAR